MEVVEASVEAVEAMGAVSRTFMVFETAAASSPTVQERSRCKHFPAQNIVAHVLGVPFILETDTNDKESCLHFLYKTLIQTQTSQKLRQVTHDRFFKCCRGNIKRKNVGEIRLHVIVN